MKWGSNMAPKFKKWAVYEMMLVFPCHTEHGFFHSIEVQPRGIQWFVLMTPFFIPIWSTPDGPVLENNWVNVWVWPFWPVSFGTIPFGSKIYLLKRSKVAGTNEIVFTFWFWPSLRLSKVTLLALSLHFRFLTTPLLSHQKWSRKLLVALLLEINVVMSDPCKHSIIDIAAPFRKNQSLFPTLWTHVKTLPPSNNHATCVFLFCFGPATARDPKRVRLQTVILNWKRDRGACDHLAIQSIHTTGQTHKRDFSCVRPNPFARSESRIAIFHCLTQTPPGHERPGGWFTNETKLRFCDVT